MNDSRIEMLRKFIDEDPSDPFNYYALALEYHKTNPEIARQLFDDLMHDHADYLPVYYTAGIFYEESGNPIKAVEIFKAGIALATRNSDYKALRELQSALQNIDY